MVLSVPRPVAALSFGAVAFWGFAPSSFTVARTQHGASGPRAESSGAAVTGQMQPAADGASSCLAAGAGGCLAAAAVAVAAAKSRRRSSVPRSAENSQDIDRRQLLSAAFGVAAVAAPSVPAHAVAGLFGDIPGPFERDPKDAVLVEDPNTPEAKEAKQLIQEYKQQNDKALAMLRADQQADLDFLLANKVADIAILRRACINIDKLMDDRTANGTRLLGRLMTQSRYRILEEAEFPLNRKGQQVGRGPARAERLIANMETFSEKSGKLLQFLA
eukprot:CAMPEP_0178434568 /NCGR_PEP_ID=MMETSP0689_2-20121128/33489_1 /TAXON_ID=160604 /ORGANISM="Amphidinium massartii, Strain CS-259" /LENGTH=273 /DNA_ID=CAMNT_0020056633 /DNA_START=236 /DNA_END=1057 /DNA_ORIENTATION=-